MRALRITILGLLLITAGFLLGQSSDSRVGQKPVGAAKAAVEADPEVSDVAFRVKGMRNGRAYGTLVTKVDGKWVEVETAPHTALLGK